MNENRIRDVADLAARSVRKKFEFTWTSEDWEDARQEAALGILRAIRRHPEKREAFYMNAGMWAIMTRTFRQNSIAHAQPIEARGAPFLCGRPIEANARGWARPLTDEDFPRLRDLMLAVRATSGARQQKAAVEDAIILIMASQGTSQSAIAQILGMTAHNVHCRLRLIRNRLADYANKKGVES